MPRPSHVRFLRLGGALLLAAAGMLAQAAELGEVVVRSYAGQPLVADIEITGIADDAIAVQVRPASADIYRGANVRVHPVLASVFMSVMRRDGKQFLHVTSVKPAEGDHVLLFLELNDGGRRTVRSVTLWLSPDPTPAPPPAPPPVEQLAARAAEAPAHAPAVDAAAVASGATAHARTPAAALAPALRARAGGAAVCATQFSAEQIKTCSELDYKNGVLSAQIIELEEKVKALQLAMDAKPAAAPAPIAAAAHAAALTPVPKPKPKATPWLLIGGAGAAAAALMGAGWFFFLRGKGKAKDKGKEKAKDKAAAESPTAPAKAGLMAGLKARFARKKKAPADAADPAAHG
jgi:hypothetical protein